MKDKFIKKLRKKLRKSISRLDASRSLFLKNPDRDFTRSRKISFSDVLWAMISLQSKSLPNEMMDFFGHSVTGPTASAFIQQRKKILTEAYQFLFHSFLEECSSLQHVTLKGFRLLAADGSDLNIYRNPSDDDTFINEGGRGYNAIHMNALYDLLNHTYADVVFQGKSKLHERAAFNTMVDRYRSRIPSIFVADRGYESYNTFAHVIRRGQFFLIRIKDISSNGILSVYDLPDSEFDHILHTTLTRRHTRETLDNPDIYTILQQRTEFDFLDDSCTSYEMEFRIARFQAGDGYVCVATNLPADEFSLDDLKYIYRLRWGEENSFRELKYTVGLVNFHSRTKEFILQEIYSRLILYNFCEMVTNHAAVVTRKNTKHCYKIYFATAVNICRDYLKNGGDETEVLLLIQKHLTPIRPDRKYPMNLKPKRNRDFMYRAA